jgi:hypothetical protein
MERGTIIVLGIVAALLGLAGALFLEGRSELASLLSGFMGLAMPAALWIYVDRRDRRAFEDAMELFGPGSGYHQASAEEAAALRVALESEVFERRPLRLYRVWCKPRANGWLAWCTYVQSERRGPASGIAAVAWIPSMNAARLERFVSAAEMGERPEVLRRFRLSVGGDWAIALHRGGPLPEVERTLIDLERWVDAVASRSASL